METQQPNAASVHARANMTRPGAALRERFIYGAPVFAPLLFANLALLAAIGLHAVHFRTASIASRETV